MKKAILENYFRSKCFYWIDVGYFRKEINKMQKYVNNWPKPDKCLADDRIVMGQVKLFSEQEKKLIINFDRHAHYRLRGRTNVAGGFFGGQIKNTLKFINLYYYTIKLFLKNKKFIGKDQNIFTYIAFAHPEVVQLIFFRTYFGFKKYLA